MVENFHEVTGRYPASTLEDQQKPQVRRVTRDPGMLLIDCEQIGLRGAPSEDGCFEEVLSQGALKLASSLIKEHAGSLFAQIKRRL